jgi:hypothetical protein
MSLYFVWTRKSLQRWDGPPVDEGRWRAFLSATRSAAQKEDEAGKESRALSGDGRPLV